MRVCFVYYNTCALFEVTTAALFLSQKAEVVTAGPEMEDYVSMEGLKLRPHFRLRDMDWSSVDMLIVPGGIPEKILGNEDLSNAIRQVHSRGRPVAAICGGPTHLAQAGVLKGRRFTASGHENYKVQYEGAIFTDADVEVDGNIVTALPFANVDFAFQLADMLQIWKDEADRQETVRQFKQFQRC